MSGRDAVENGQAAVAATDGLNLLSQPLGYAVTGHTDVGQGTDDPTARQFTVHRIDHPVCQGTSFDTADGVRAHLDELAKLPRWRLDLDDDSIRFDTTTLTVTDKRTGESFCLKAWKSFGIAGVILGDQTPCAPVGVRHISVVAERPPTIGHWYNSDDG